MGSRSVRSVVRVFGVSVSLAAIAACTEGGGAVDDSTSQQGSLREARVGDDHHDHRGPSRFVDFHAPAGDRPTAIATTVDGKPGAILPNGRFVTPAGVEVNVAAPKPF